MSVNASLSRDAQRPSVNEMLALEARPLEKEKNIQPLSLIDSLPQLQQGVGNWELIPIGASVMNAYQLYKICQRIEQESPEWPRLIAEYPVARSRRLRAKEQKLNRLYYRYYMHGLRVLKVSTILIPQRLLRKGVAGVIDAASHALSLRERTTVTEPEQILRLRAFTWKDKLHNGFKMVVSSLQLAGSLFAVANAMGYVEETNTLFSGATSWAMNSLIADISYGALQKCGCLLQRE